ncbi:unnamed protein product [Didymodactylos carnosus]|uniref:MRH domain-containing protein n=1 Tax=Didymodactylos carnosus TaxID=1234261 RepID=A0A8S2IA76_9BILA|nr:unnamed protein product [Didymodactylos carnosus]CAF3720268.1 unnamed protein product [Didymodactylos carnosus]
MRFTLFLIAFTLTVQECESTKDCKYKDGLFGRIDLTSVGLKNTPAFRNLPSTGQPDIYFYSYNPCYPFNEASCSDVAGCQITRSGNQSFALASHTSVSWSVTPTGNVSLIYDFNGRMLTVNLMCSTELDQLEIYGEYELKKYNMTLFSRCACWNGC